MKKKQDSKDYSLENLKELIIEQNFETRIAYQLLLQIHPHLPISSFKELNNKLKDVVQVENHKLSTDIFTPYVPEALFPIDNIKDLIAKISSFVKIALSIAKHGNIKSIKNPAIQSLVEHFSSTDFVGRNDNSVGYFNQPSLFGYTINEKK